MALVKRQIWKLRRNCSKWVKSWIVRQQGKRVSLYLSISSSLSSTANQSDFSHWRAQTPTCSVSQIAATDSGRLVPTAGTQQKLNPQAQTNVRPNSSLWLNLLVDSSLQYFKLICCQIMTKMAAVLLCRLLLTDALHFLWLLHNKSQLRFLPS